MALFSFDYAHADDFREQYFFDYATTLCHGANFFLKFFVCIEKAQQQGEESKHFD